jgi:hypothetical protein
VLRWLLCSKDQSYYYELLIEGNQCLLEFILENSLREHTDVLLPLLLKVLRRTLPRDVLERSRVCVDERVRGIMEKAHAECDLIMENSSEGEGEKSAIEEYVRLRMTDAEDEASQVISLWESNANALTLFRSYTRSLESLADFKGVVKEFRSAGDRLVGGPEVTVPSLMRFKSRLEKVATIATQSIEATLLCGCIEGEETTETSSQPGGIRDVFRSLTACASEQFLSSSARMNKTVTSLVDVQGDIQESHQGASEEEVDIESIEKFKQYKQVYSFLVATLSELRPPTVEDILQSVALDEGGGNTDSSAYIGQFLLLFSTFFWYLFS